MPLRDEGLGRGPDSGPDAPKSLPWSRRLLSLSFSAPLHPDKRGAFLSTLPSLWPETVVCLWRSRHRDLRVGRGAGAGPPLPPELGHPCAFRCDRPLQAAPARAQHSPRAQHPPAPPSPEPRLQERWASPVPLGARWGDGREASSPTTQCGSAESPLGSVASHTFLSRLRASTLRSFSSPQGVGQEKSLPPLRAIQPASSVAVSLPQQNKSSAG